MSEETTVGSAFTNKEMWVRVDAKLDTLVARQQHFDVELALLKERATQHELALAKHNDAEERDRQRLAADLEKAEALMAQEVESIKAGQFNIQRAVKYAAGVIITVGILADAVIRFYR